MANFKERYLAGEIEFEEIDDYVQALTAFLPTPTQRKMIQEQQ